MISFLQYSKQKEREEFIRQMNRFYEMANTSRKTAESLKAIGDNDGYLTFMAKEYHQRTQGDILKKALGE
jgi:hypothetical protein